MKTAKDNNSYGQLYRNLVDRITKGDGHSSREDRLAAFNNANLPQPLHTLTDKVVHSAYKITDGEINAVKQTGVSENQLFELIICAAVGQAARQYENGLKALNEALKEGGSHAS